MKEDIMSLRIGAGFILFSVGFSPLFAVAGNPAGQIAPG